MDSAHINTFVPNYTLPILIVICGATATGKSRLAMQIAQRLPALVISADSRQVYREFDIGTAKPSIADQQQVPHHLIDICEPTETLTLADYQEMARQLIEKDGRDGRDGRDGEQNPKSKIQNPKSIRPIPLLVGGTGLYIKSIVRGLRIPRVGPQSILRAQLASWGQPFCYQLLQQVDAGAAAKIHANDQVRTLRALEVFYVTGQPISQQQGEQPPNYPILQIGLDCCDLDRLTQRIEQRTQQMIAAGFAAEVEALCQKYGADLPLLNTLGYQEMKQHLAGVPLREAAAEIVLHTRQFAKQQRTWFRADPTIEWFDADAPDLLTQVWQRIEQFLDSNISPGTSTSYS
ncbi:MAG: tRNA (adenosine(37)-N6)-dimethylallyltransferase MiaA [Cyanobacteria bacterium RM1_2_2]|nr:tRNA (adenosine(37)-N6)-dimethylallyltransferase MiaA [Cyanobacteria bacterium RM1_2_2]